MGEKNASRLVYLIERRQDAIYQGVYGAIAAVLAAGCWALGAPFFASVFAVIGGVFLLKSGFAWLTHLRQKKIVASGTADASSEEESLDPDDLVETLDLGAAGGKIRLIYSRDVLESQRACIEKLRTSIAGDPEGFVRKFDQFRADNVQKYRKYSQFIATLQIRSLEVFRGEKCVATVYFTGSLSEVWRTEYTGEGFTELIWV